MSYNEDSSAKILGIILAIGIVLLILYVIMLIWNSVIPVLMVQN